MDKRLINPYDLFGINIDSSINELKKAYYEFAMITHPDKGGTDEDMCVISAAYNYVKEQLENKSNKSFEDVENEFNEFLLNQKSEKPPKFSEIYNEIREFLDEFNREFEKKYDDQQCPFRKGYGSLMDNQTHDLNNYTDNYNDIEEKGNVNKFTKEIITYEEPLGIPNYIDDKYPLDKKEITDFSSKEYQDYYLAYCNPEKIKEDIEEFNVMKKYEKLLEDRNYSIDRDYTMAEIDITKLHD